MAVATPCLPPQTCAPKTGEVGWEQKERVGPSFAWLIFITYLDNSKKPRIKTEQIEISIFVWLFVFLNRDNRDGEIK